MDFESKKHGTECRGRWRRELVGLAPLRFRPAEATDGAEGLLKEVIDDRLFSASCYP
jgi:hypothetical protein